MKILKFVLLTSIAAMGLIPVSAQTVDEIVNKYIDAMGGKDKLASIKTIYTENELSIMNNPAGNKTYQVNGKGYKSETDFSGQIIIDCYTVDSGWSINPLAGVNVATNMPPAQVKIGQVQLDVAGPLVDYAAKGNKVELMGKENINGAESYKLKVTTATGVEIHFFIDAATYYILKEVTKINANGQDVEIATVYSDYRKTPDGFVRPFTAELTFPGLTFTIINKKIEINKEIDAGIFEKPKG